MFRDNAVSNLISVFCIAILFVIEMLYRLMASSQ